MARFGKAWRKKLGLKQSGRIKVATKAHRTCDGIVFASASEMHAYQLLKSVVRPESLVLQPAFELQPKFRDALGKVRQPVHYVADFMLTDVPRPGAADPVPPGAVVIDHKGMRTDVFTLKAKLFAYRYGVELHLPRSKKDWAALLERPELKPFIKNDIRRDQTSSRKSRVRKQGAED